MNRPLLMLSVMLLSLVVTASASADNSARCEGRVIEQPFAAFGDPLDYFLAPDGDFSGGASGWELAGAEVVAENEPYYVHGGDTAAAVRLESGASATSPTICVAEDDPTMRFFARSTGDPTGTLDVEVLYTDDARRAAVADDRHRRRRRHRRVDARSCRWRSSRTSTRWPSRSASPRRAPAARG